MTLLLGIDIGTSGSKGALVRADGHTAGRLVAQAAREHPPTPGPRPGRARRARGVVGGLPPPGRGVAGRRARGRADRRRGRERHRPLPAADGRRGRAAAPGDPVRVDTRAGEQIAAQRAAYGDRRVLERCGSPLTSQAVGPKLAWLREEEPEVWARTRRWFMASSYLAHRLTGAYVLDHHSASQCVPLYDLRGGGWIEQWCEEIAPGLEWPRLVWPSEVVGKVTAEAAALTGVPAGTPVIAGTVDAWSEATAAGRSRPAT
ncbi:FGGY family carbohydrate kinase [Streptomyces sp. M19]